MDLRLLKFSTAAILKEMRRINFVPGRNLDEARRVMVKVPWVESEF